MYYLSYLVSLFLVILAPIKKVELTFSPFRIAAAGSVRYFSIEKAKKELGYAPVVSLREGMKRTVEYAKTQIAAGNL
jgi:sterol-4alpha-carboxylate 3-dehydrogenase (decarboxylating)